MALSPNFTKAINTHWERMQHATRIKQGKKKKTQPINRDAELAEMERFIANKGVTLCTPVKANNEQPSFQLYFPKPLS